MKVLMQTGYGDLISNLDILETSKPEILAGEVLVKVHYAGVNPHDYKVVLGDFKRMETLSFPNPVGSDFSGTIVLVGDDVKHFVEGDEVYGIIHGSIAEYCKADVSSIYLKPNYSSHLNMSVMPVAGLTTIQAFNRIGGISNGDSILIHAGSGGVGSFAIQYAKSFGATVYTTTGTSNLDWVKQLGADRVIDYKKENYLEVCNNIDIVFDTLGGQYTFDAFKIIKKGGKVVSLLPAEINKQVAKEFKMPKLIAFFMGLKPSRIRRLVRDRNATYEFVFMQPNQQSLIKLSDFVEGNKISAIVEKVFEFKDSIKAFEHLKRGHTKGKVSIKIQE